MNAPTGNVILDAALSYAARGWPVFPCCPRQKRPLTPKESAPGAKDGGLYVATTDEEQIRGWWRKWPKAMIGVPTGPRTGNVLDLDLGDPQLITGAEYLDRLRAHVGGIPETAITETGSGGYHLWFTWDPARPVANGANVVPALYIPPVEDAVTAEGKKAKGAQIDIRGEGGYVIVPPSVRSDGRAYSWCPEPWDGIAAATPELAKILTKDEVKEAKEQARAEAAKGRGAWGKRERPAGDDREPYRPEPTGDAARDGIARYAASALDKEIVAASTAGAGGRNHALNTAAFKLAQLVGAGALSEATVRAALEDAAQRSGLLADDGPETVRKTIESGFNAGLGKPRDLSGIGARARRAESRQAEREAGGASSFGSAPGEGGEHESDAQLTRIALEYPIPPLTTPHVCYEFSRGRIMLHKEVEGARGRGASLIPVTTPFGATARLRFIDREEAYGLRVAIQDMAGKPRYVDIERSDLARMGGAPVRERLFREGLKTEDDGEHIAIRCLKAASPEIEISVVSRPGWHEASDLPHPVFFAPSGEVIGSDGDTSLELATSARLQPAAAQGGTFEGWREAVGLAIDTDRCEHFTIGVCSGFVGPLLSLMKLDTCGINLSGISSSGKSTAQQLAVSAWSTPDKRQPGLSSTAKTTTNAIEGLAARANGTVLSLDELAHASGQEVAKMIYTLSGGVGKGRMTAEASMREATTWSTFTLFSSECSLEEKVRGDGVDWAPGMAARFADLDVSKVNRDVERPYMDRIHAVAQHYGHAGPAFVRALVEAGLHKDATALSDQVHALAVRIAGPDADQTRRRAALPFALVRMAGEMAVRFGILPPETSVAGSVGWAWSLFMLSSDARALDPKEQVITKLQTWIIQRWAVTIRHVSSGGGARDAEGWFDMHSVYLPRELLRTAAGGIMTEEAIASVLQERGFLTKTEKDRAGKYVRYVPGGVGKVSAYALSRVEFGREEDPAGGYSTGRGSRD